MLRGVRTITSETLRFFTPEIPRLLRRLLTTRRQVSDAAASEIAGLLSLQKTNGAPDQTDPDDIPNTKAISLLPYHEKNILYFIVIYQIEVGYKPLNIGPLSSR